MFDRRELCQGEVLRFVWTFSVVVQRFEKNFTVSSISAP